MNDLELIGQSTIKNSRVIEDEHKTKFIIHRGYNYNNNTYPENSIPSFQGADGNFGIETDIQLTKDNEIVCIHDDTLDRTTNLKGKVKDKTLSEIRNGFLVDYFRGREETLLKVPTFEEYLDICIRTKCYPVIEIKSNDFDDTTLKKVLSIVENKGILYDCIFISFHYNQLERLNRLNNKVKKQLLSKTFNETIFNQTKTINADLSLNQSSVTKEIVSRLHGINKKVSCWTVNDYNRINELKKMGVDFITTDETQEQNRVWSPLPKDIKLDYIVSGGLYTKGNEWYTVFRQTSYNSVNVVAIVQGFYGKDVAGNTPIFTNLPFWTIGRHLDVIWLGGGIGRLSGNAFPHQVTSLNVKKNGGVADLLTGYSVKDISFILLRSDYII